MKQIIVVFGLTLFTLTSCNENKAETKNKKETMEYNIEKLMKSTGSIGAYAKEADNAFQNLIRETSFGDFDRIDWQLINFLNNNPKTTKSFITDFLSFLGTQDEIENRIKRFEAKSIINIQKNEVLLTNIGKSAFDEAYQIQKEILEASFKDITEEDYKICIEVLKKMIKNMSPYIKQDNN
jgi:DNA-binding MarR family transcriptional regulator